MLLGQVATLKSGITYSLHLTKLGRVITATKPKTRNRTVATVDDGSNWQKFCQAIMEGKDEVAAVHAIDASVDPDRTRWFWDEELGTSGWWVRSDEPFRLSDKPCYVELHDGVPTYLGVRAYELIEREPVWLRPETEKDKVV